MVTKKKSKTAPRPKAKAVILPFKKLEERVTTLERDVHMLRSSMGTLTSAVETLKTTVVEIDSRTKRGELVMLTIQGEQRKMSRLIEGIAEALEVKLAKPIPASSFPDEVEVTTRDEFKR